MRLDGGQGRRIETNKTNSRTDVVMEGLSPRANGKASKFPSWGTSVTRGLRRGESHQDVQVDGRKERVSYGKTRDGGPGPEWESEWGKEEEEPNGRQEGS